MCVRGIYFSCFCDFSILLWNCSDSVVFFVLHDFGIVPTVWYFLFFMILELFPQCGIFVLHDFGIVPTVWYLFFFMILELFQNVVFVFMILELFRQCGNFYYNTLLCAINYNLKFIKVDLETNQKKKLKSYESLRKSESFCFRFNLPHNSRFARFLKIYIKYVRYNGITELYIQK